LNIGFIGCGNMGGAVISGILSSGAFTPAQIGVFDVFAPAAEKYEQKGIKAYGDCASLISTSDVVFIAVKPKDVEKMLTENSRSFMDKDPLIISIVTGKTISYLEDCLSYKASLVRVIPNYNATVLASQSVYCMGERTTPENEKTVEEIIGSIGNYIKLPESYFSIYSAIASCSPAYIYLLIDAMAEAGVKNGLSKADAVKIAAGTVAGSAEEVLKSGEHPRALIDRVCSPGGTTIEGLVTLQKEGFETAVTDAIQAAFDKDSRV
jgi:pyrroline-5-carboxylate reductase